MAILRPRLVQSRIADGKAPCAITVPRYQWGGTGCPLSATGDTSTGVISHHHVSKKLTLPVAIKTKWRGMSSTYIIGSQTASLTR